MNTMAIVQNIMLTVGMPLLLALGWQGVGVLQKRGYQTTYAAAVLKAVGAGQIAAANNGLSLFTGEGRALAIKTGVEYLYKTVPQAADALGITTVEDHAQRIDSQIGLLAATAEAATLAASKAALLTK